MRNFFVALCIVIISNAGCSIKEKKEEKFTANWESLQKYNIPQWFQDAKFGIFIHWGVYSVPAFDNEWYPRHMYQDSVQWHQTDSTKSKKGMSPVYAHHLNTYGHPSVFGYKDFIPMFKAEKFDPQAWVTLFKKAGAKYIVPVAEHHDGFAMYNSHITRWNAVAMGPKRDIIAELQEASSQAGLKFGVSSHFAFNWSYYNHQKRFDTGNPLLEDLYGPSHKRYAKVSDEFMKLWWARTTDIINTYKPDIFWFDFYIDRPEFAPYHPKLAAYYYNMGIDNHKEVVLQTKNMGYNSFPEGTNVLDIERGKLADIRKESWQTDTSIGINSWCHVSDWKSRTANSLIDDLVDIVSKNGNLLLNVGPKADGTIPQDQVKVLLQMGDWLSKNSEAIYNTRPWKIYGEGPTKDSQGHHSEAKNKAATSEDIRFTTHGETLYAIALDWPKNNTLTIKSLASTNPYESRPIQSIDFISDENSIKWEQTVDGLLIHLEGEQNSQSAFVFKIKFN